MSKEEITGSLHKHTSGYGYGSWRTRPPADFVSSTWVSPRTRNWVPPDCGTPITSNNLALERRAAASRDALVSGEIGEWMYGEKKSPSRTLTKVRARTVSEEATTTRTWVRRPFVYDEPILAPVPDLERPPQTSLSLDEGKLDPTLDRAHHRLDLAFHRAPDKVRLPFQAHEVNASAAVAQNALGASLTAHWTHSLRGQKY